ncbi:MAG TPA: nucleotidyltransferase domain-containing protein [Thermoanaerobaculia bacterium]|nr:nucleotidyltransferase domain-containing protein [Thermoanaerobaculia bacterium]
MRAHIAIDKHRLRQFCRDWQVTELSLFGSVLRADFGPESDVDVLVTFDAAAHPSLTGLLQMEEELASMLGRKVDLVTRRSVEESANYIRRKAILGSAEPLYAG